MNIKMFAVLLLIGLLFVPTQSQTREKKLEASIDEIDYLGLVSVLINDKHFDRALVVLAEVDLKNPMIDKGKYYLLLGLTELSIDNPTAARIALKKSIRYGTTDKMVYVFLAQACFKLEKYQETIAHLKKAGAAATELPATYMLRANAHWKRKQMGDAWNALDSGMKKFPDNLDIHRSKVILLVETGLYQEAIKEGKAYLSRDEMTADDYTTISEAFLKGEVYDEAILILETARLLFPKKSELTVQLARAYMKNGQELVSARLFHRASLNDLTFVADAAELYRRQGKFHWALRLNEKVVDQKLKIRQRMGILLEMGRFEEAAALGPRLFRLGLLEVDSITYGLAYALFKTGALRKADTYLSRIKDSDYFTKAMELRLAIDRCKASGWQCE